MKPPPGVLTLTKEEQAKQDAYEAMKSAVRWGVLQALLLFAGTVFAAWLLWILLSSAMSR